MPYKWWTEESRHYPEETQLSGYGIVRQQTLVITDLHITDFGYDEQNLAVYTCEFLQMLRH
jgi:hypothetical protein